MALKFNPATGKFEEDMMDMASNELASTPIQPIKPETTQPMDPTVKDYLMKKFDFGKYSDEARQKLIEDSQLGFGDKAGAALAAIGAGFMGKDAGAAGQAKLAAAKADKKAALDAFDTGRRNMIEGFDLDRKATGAAREDEKYAKDQDLLKREQDPNSEESKMADELARKMGYKGGPITAEKFKSFSPTMQKMYELEQSKSEKALDRQIKMEQIEASKANRAAADADRKQKANELNASDAKYLTQIQSGSDAVDAMGKALEAGDNTFSLIGDNDFTRNARVAAEMYGRLQSGGAINKDEEERFIAMLPKMTDSAEQQQKKLAQAKAYYEQAKANFKGGKYKDSGTAPKEESKKEALPQPKPNHRSF